jgi:GH15 family glucan-1,4-alpha-glucosidase
VLAGAFLTKISPVIIDAATFIEQGAADPLKHGFGPKDNSIWEDRFQWAGFTQITYAAGLYAASALAQVPGVSLSTRSANWLTSARGIRSAITRPWDAATCSGLWDEQTGSLFRGIDPDCTVDRRTDASSNLIAVLGLLAADDPKAAGHRNRTIARLQPQQRFNVEGVSRFEFDDFYSRASTAPEASTSARCLSLCGRR